jgi:L-seryl-tRNA(Ser) seleniumtransferase
MTASNSEARQAAFRLLPSVDELLRDEAVLKAGAGMTHERLVRALGEILDSWRAAIGKGRLDADGLSAHLNEGGAAAALAERQRAESRRGVVPIVNATGVVLNTGLGRAPVHPEAAEAMKRAAAGYCVLEVDRETGKRNRRDEYLASLVCELTGAEAGIVVNNCAGSVMLVLSTFAREREAIVSRGELVEIGGSFRVPAVMERAGAKLVEAGTTNRTRLSDYSEKLNKNTGLLLKVHTSNYRVVGFTEEVSPTDLAALGGEHEVPTAYDLGSGLLESDGLKPLPLGDEPRVLDAVASGVDVVMFSGDKLFGGPQAGFMVGKKRAIDALRDNPVYRALRCDKVTLAGLEETLKLYLAGRGDEIPSRAMMTRDLKELQALADEIANAANAIDGFTATVIPERSQPGSGSAPDIFIDTFAARLTHASLSPDALSAALRHGEPSVFSRIADDALVLDPRTLLEGDLERLLGALAAVEA